MINFLNGIISSLASGLMRRLKRMLILPLKIELLRIYIRAVGIARDFSVWILTAISMLLLMAVAFVMVHVGVLIILPVGLEAKGLIVLILGIAYGVVAYSILKDICSEKAWLDMFKANEMLNDLLNKKDED